MAESYFLLSVFWRHFHTKNRKIKNPKTYNCWEYKILLSCKSQLKQWKTEKLVWKRSLFDDSWPYCVVTNFHTWGFSSSFYVGMPGDQHLLQETCFPVETLENHHKNNVRQLRSKDQGLLNWKEPNTFYQCISSKICLKEVIFLTQMMFWRTIIIYIYSWLCFAELHCSARIYWFCKTRVDLLN